VKYFTVDSVATFVHHRGPTTLPGDPPVPGRAAAVLCLHDTAGNGNVFAGVLDALARDHGPIAFDLPAHGRSGGLDSLPSVAAMAGHAKALADRLALSSPVLLGEGLGAVVALEAAATWPDWPAALVLAGGASATPAPSTEQIEQVRLVTAGRARREFDRTGYAPDTGPPVYQRAFGEWMKTDPRATLGDLLALAAWDGTARVAAVSVPITVIVGEHEPAEARAAAETLASSLSRGRVVTLAGAGRRGVLEQPEGLAAIVASVAEAVPA
jgi:pimeloyl-ACP methyl ester carboxylesterase